jgi:preprotein translocase subunit SecE
MSVQAESAVSVADIVKLILSVVMTVAGIWAFDHYADVQLLYRVLGLVALMAAVVAMFFTTAKGHAVWGFVLESKLEAKRVVWPTKDETFRTTVLVVAMVVIVGLLLWIIDYVLYQVIDSLMNLGIR